MLVTADIATPYYGRNERDGIVTVISGIAAAPARVPILNIPVLQTLLHIYDCIVMQFE